MLNRPRRGPIAATAVLGVGTVGFGHLRDDVAEIQGLQMRRGVALDLGQPQHRIEGAQGLGEVLVDFADVLDQPRRVSMAAAQAVELLADAGQGRAQVVGDVGRDLADVAHEHDDPVEHVVHRQGQVVDVVAQEPPALGDADVKPPLARLPGDGPVVTETTAKRGPSRPAPPYAE